MKANFVIKQGESLTLILERLEGDISVVETAIAKLKKAGPRGTIPPVEEPVIYTLITIPYENGWYFTLTGTQTAALPVGFYVVDATLFLVEAEVDKTEMILLEVQRSVS